MKRIITILAVAMMSLLAFNTARADVRDDLVAAAQECNASCPQGDDDVVLKSVKVEGNNLVLTYVMQVGKSELDMIKTVEADMMEGIVADMRTDEIFSRLLDLCKQANCTFVVRFSNPQGQYADLKLPASKL